MISALQMSCVNLGDDPLFSVLCIEKVFPELTLHRVCVATAEEDGVPTLSAAQPLQTSKRFLSADLLRIKEEETCKAQSFLSEVTGSDVFQEAILCFILKSQICIFTAFYLLCFMQYVQLFFG